MSDRRVALVYKGQAEGQSGKLLYIYVRADDPEGEEFPYSRALIKKQGRPGTTILVWMDETDTVMGHEKEFGDRFKDHALVVQWQAALDVLRLTRKKRAERHENWVRKDLDNMRRLYTSLNAKRRQALLALIIEHVTGG